MDTLCSHPNIFFGVQAITLNPSSSSRYFHAAYEEKYKDDKSHINNELQGQTGVNQMGGTYINGKALPDDMRLKIIEMSKRGLKAADISRHLKVSHGCVSKLLRRYKITGSYKAGSTGGSKPKVAVPKVVETIRKYKEETPAIFAWEIKERLLAENVCTEENVPSISSINRIVRLYIDTSSRRPSLGSTSPSSNESTSPPVIKKSPTSHFIRDILGDVISNDKSRKKRKLELDDFVTDINKSLKRETQNDFPVKEAHDNEISPSYRRSLCYSNVYPGYYHYPYGRIYNLLSCQVGGSDAGHQTDSAYNPYPGVSSQSVLTSISATDRRKTLIPGRDTLCTQSHQDHYNVMDSRTSIILI